MLGWRARLTGTILALAVVFVIALDRQTYSNHLYLMAWLTALLVAADAGDGLAIRTERRRVTFWPVILLCLQLTIVYVFSALTKINDSFLSGEVLAGVLTRRSHPIPRRAADPADTGPTRGGGHRHRGVHCLRSVDRALASLGHPAWRFSPRQHHASHGCAW